ncbi:MAG: winged helix DNA-binding domain-containing protein [Solirubrobacteraceae bacterium]|nr:winged helix DNA-binding domain-containing protein [Patulibacter sp.]
MFTLTADDAVARRVAAQGLADPVDDPCTVLRAWTVQDSPPGAALGALLARTVDLPVGWLDSALEERAVVAMYNARTATALLPSGDVAAFATALLPSGDDDAALKAILGQALPDHDGGYEEPVGLAVDAISSILDGRVLSRDDLHEELRGALPASMLPWCEGCRSHHARRGLLVLAGLHGRLCLAGKAGRQPRFARTDQWIGGWSPPSAAGTALVRRFLHAYGPATRQHFQAWSGLGTAHARALWDGLGEEVVPASLDGAAVTMLAVDGTEPGDGAGSVELGDRTDAGGIRLLAPGDPLLLGRDRETLIADAAVRTRLFGAIPTTGLVLSGGRPVATWKAKKGGKRLDATVDAFGAVDATALEAAFAQLAPHRGCTSASVSGL